MCYWYIIYLKQKKLYFLLLKIHYFLSQTVLDNPCPGKVEEVGPCKKYMLQKAGIKCEIRVRRTRKMHEMRNQRSSKDPQKLPNVVSVMKNRFHGVKRNPENESELSPLDISFKRHGGANNIDNRKSKLYFFVCNFFISCYIIFVCTLSCCVQRLLSRLYWNPKNSWKIGDWNFSLSAYLFIWAYILAYRWPILIYVITK